MIRTGHSPSLTVGDFVSIDSGPHAGLAGEVLEIVIESAGHPTWLMVRLQDKTFVQVNRSDVSVADPAPKTAA